MRLALALLISLTGCTVITALEPTECRSHRDCEILNGPSDPGYGAIDDCVRWHCSGAPTEGEPPADLLDLPLQPGSCILAPLDLDNDGVPGPVCVGEPEIDCDDGRPGVSPGVEETCNGIDDDCDGSADEGLLPDAAAPIVVDGIGNRLTSFSATRYPEGAIIGWATDDGESVLANSAAASATVVSPSAQPAARLATGVELEVGCWSWGSEDLLRGECRAAGCPDPDASVASVRQQCIDTEGCTPFERRASCRLSQVVAAPLDDGFVVAGVDSLGADAVLRAGFVAPSAPMAVGMLGPRRRSNAFAGLDLETAMLRSTREGVSNPALASFGGQALLTWVADSGRGDCGGAVAEVRALALHRQTYTDDPPWLEASNGAVAQVLGTTTAGGPPALLAGESGYLVAHAEAGGILLQRVPAAEPPPRFTVDDVPLVQSEPHSSGQTTPPLEGPVAVGTIGVSGAHDLALATSNESDAVAVVYRTGCGTDDEGVWVTVATITGDTLGETAAARRLAGSNNLSAPAVLWDPSDRVWIVAWLENPDAPGTSISLQRLTVEGVPVGGVARRPVAFARERPALFVDGSGVVRAQVLTLDGTFAVRDIPLSCGEG